jgi:ankyrin repeat protein
MANKLNIKVSIINTGVSLLLLLSCKPVSLNMIENEDEKKCPEVSDVINLDEQAIISILRENNLLDNPDEALFWALKNDQPEIAKWLITTGRANVNVKDKIGDTPLHFAAFKGHIEVTEVLINAEADLDAKNHYGRTALREAAAGSYSSSRVVN